MFSNISLFYSEVNTTDTQPVPGPLGHPQIKVDFAFVFGNKMKQTLHFTRISGRQAASLGPMWWIMSDRRTNEQTCTFMYLNCHNPTNNPKQLKTNFVGVVILSV